MYAELDNPYCTLLQDPVRDFCYAWAISKMKNSPPIEVLDIGSRNSKFPTFLAYKGYKVDVVERDNFFPCHESLMKHWGVYYNYYHSDFLKISGSWRVIFSIFALQHSVDTDIECYRKCSQSLKRGGELFIVNEYCENKSSIQRGRNDGDMRIYSGADILDRVLTPIRSNVNLIYEIEYANFIFKGQEIKRVYESKKANIIMLRFSDATNR